MRSHPEDLRTSLIYAREAVKHAPTWRKYHRRNNKWDNEPYGWCQIGWETNHRRGYFYDIPNALRPFTFDGDLTHWWHHGQSRASMLALFDQAIGSIPKDLAA